MEKLDNYSSSGKRVYPRDLIHNFPPVQEGKTVKNKRFSAFAVSLQGASHVKKDVPCQDYSDIRILEDSCIILGGIADGVGSCPLSHWGAYIAVMEALDYTEEQIRREEETLTDRTVQRILHGAFDYACKRVEEAADYAGQAVRNLQSTLTVAIYSGRNLYCCHAGDDGVVAQTTDGVVKMATNRQKGEEANSVYPLQTGRWEITKVQEQVAGFIMATDGVLDAFALPYPDFNKINYFNRVYYPFMEPALYGMINKKSREPVEETLEYYKKYLASEPYRRKVTDDLTIAAVIAPKVLQNSVHPDFDKDRWNRIEAESEKKKADILGYRKREEACTRMTDEEEQPWEPEDIGEEKTSGESEGLEEGHIRLEPQVSRERNISYGPENHGEKKIFRKPENRKDTEDSTEEDSEEIGEDKKKYPGLSDKKKFFIIAAAAVFLATALVVGAAAGYHLGQKKSEAHEEAGTEAVAGTESKDEENRPLELLKRNNNRPAENEEEKNKEDIRKNVATPGDTP